MHAEANRLRSFIEPTKPFIGPLFQRFYVWDKPYWNTLWGGVLELIADEDEQQTHFLGSIVVIPATSAGPARCGTENIESKAKRPTDHERRGGVLLHNITLVK